MKEKLQCNYDNTFEVEVEVVLDQIFQDDREESTSFLNGSLLAVEYYSENA